MLLVIGAPLDNQGQLGQTVSLVTQEQLEIQGQQLLQDCQVTLVQVGPVVNQVHQGQPDLLDHEDLTGTMASKVTLVLKDQRDNREPQEMLDQQEMLDLRELQGLVEKMELPAARDLLVPVVQLDQEEKLVQQLIF